LIHGWRERLPPPRPAWVVKWRHVDGNGVKVIHQSFNKLYLELESERAKQIEQQQEEHLKQALLREIHAMRSARIPNKPEIMPAAARSATKPDGFFKYWTSKVDVPKPASTAPSAQTTTARYAAGAGRPARPTGLGVDPVTSPMTVQAATNRRKRKVDTPLDAPTPTNEHVDDDEDGCNNEDDQPAAKKRRTRIGGSKSGPGVHSRFATNWFVNGWGYNAPYDFGTKSKVAAEKTLEDRAREMRDEEPQGVDSAYARLPEEQVPGSDEIEKGLTAEDKEAVALFVWKAKHGVAKDYMRSIGTDT